MKFPGQGHRSKFKVAGDNKSSATAGMAEPRWKENPNWKL